MLASKPKRLLSLLLVLVMLLGLVPTGVFAAGNGTEQNPMAHTQTQYFDQDETPVGKDDSWAVSIHKDVSQPAGYAENEFQIDLEVISKKEIEEASWTKPVRVVLVIDRSGSMSTQASGKTYMWHAQTAAKRFVNQIMASDMPDGCSVSVVAFGDDVISTNNFGKTDRTAITNAAVSFINSLKIEGGTFTQAGLHKAWQMLEEDRKNLDDPDDQKADRVIVLLSDGLPTRSYRGTAIVAADSDFNYVKPPDTGKMTQATKYPYRISEFDYDDPLFSPQWYFSAYSGMYIQNGVTGKLGGKLTGIESYKISDYTVDEHMLPTISEAYNIRQENYEVYSVLIVDRKTSDFVVRSQNNAYCDKDGVVDSAIYVMESLVNNPETQFAETSSPQNLQTLFDDIKKDITITVTAWEVNDAMSQYVTFDGLVGSSSSVQVASDKKSFLWQVWKDQGVRQSDGTYKYTLSYKVKVDNVAQALNPGAADYLTNGDTTLSYYVGEDGPTSQDDIKEVTFDVPKVGVLSGSFSFTKADKNNPSAQFGYNTAGRSGQLQNVATFTLTHAADCDCGNSGTAVVGTATTVNNTVTFTGIPSGHSYTMTETVPDGYDQSKAETYTVTVAWGEVSVTDSSGAPVKLNGFTIYNELDPKDQELTVNKTWLPSAPQDGTTVTVDVTGTNESGEPVVEETITLTGAGGWTGSITVPTIDVATGEKISYEIEEQPVAGWKLVNNEPGADLTFTLTNARSEKTTYSVEKIWVGPQTDWKDVTAKLMNGQQEVDSVTLNSSNSWSGTFDEVDVYGNDGQLITYTVVEVIDGQPITNGTFTVNGHSYNATVSPSGDKFTITNTVAQDDTVSVTGTKTWKAAALAGDGNVKATFELYADDRPTGKTVELGLADSSISFTNLPKYALNGTTVGEVTYDADADADGHEIIYTIEETGCTGLTGGDSFTQTDDGHNNFTNTLTGTTEVTVTKVWVDDDDAEGLRPTSVTFKLMNGDQEVDRVTLSATHHDAVTGDEGEELDPAYDEWTAGDLTHTFTGLDKYDANGALIRYTVVEETVDKYGNPKYEQQGNNWTVTNTLEPGETSITVSKVWVDTETSHGEVVIKILANGADSGFYATLNEGNSWSTVVEGLPMRENGKLITYTLDETDVPAGYTPDVVINGPYNFTVYNVIDQAETSVTADKTWEGGDDASRPELTFTLYADGEPTNQTIKSTDPGYDPANITFSGLEKYKYVEQDGHKLSCTEISYTIEETMDGPLADRYASDKKVDPDGTIHFTNTFSPGTTKVEGQKIWVDGGKQSHSPVTVGVFEVDEDGTVLNETPVKTTITTGSYSFTGLEAFNTDGSAKHYAVYEMDGSVRVEHGGTIVIDGETYVVSYGTGTITNTLEQDYIDIPVTKVWQGPAVEEVTFTLTREGDPVFSQTLTLTEDDAQPDGTWKGSFEDLEKYDANRNPYKYTVTENELPGYTTSRVGNVFTNTVDQVEDASLTVVKRWDMLDGSDEPASVQIRLYADGQPYNGSIEAYKNPVDISAEGDWTYIFENLPRYAYTTDGDGAVTSVKEIVYTAQEAGAVLSGENKYLVQIGHDHFEVTYGQEGGQYIITNDHLSTDIFSYQVIRNYTTYTDGQNPQTETETGPVTMGDQYEEVTVNPDDYKSYNSNNYDFVDGNIDGVSTTDFTVTLDEANHTYVITLNYQRNVITKTYTVTVNYFDETGHPIHDSYHGDPILQGSSWDVTNKKLSTVTYNGVLYHFSRWDGDPLRGDNITEDQVINLYYVPQSPNTVTITVKKVWDPATVAPVDVTVDLWRVVGTKDAVPGQDDDVKAGSVTITAGEPSATLQLPATNVADGSDYTYYAVESAPASGYIVSYSPETITPVNDGEREITVTNRVDPQNVEITVEKLWLPDNPGTVEVTVQLWQQIGQKDAVPGQGDDVKAGSVTIPAGGASGTATLPTYDVNTGAQCVYYAVETAPASGYVVHYAPASITPANSGERKITVTNVDQGSDNITVSKSWDTVAGFDTTATLVLLRNGAIVDSVELTGNNSHTFTGLPLRDPNGQAYTYTVAEWGADTDGDRQIDLNELVYDGGSVTVGGHQYAVAISGLNVTNTFVTGTVDISGEKKWVDGNNESGNRPNEVTVKLLKNGAETGMTQTAAAPDWDFTFTDLAEYEKVEGVWTKNVYTVTDVVPGYTASAGSEGNNYTLTNTISQGKVSVSVEKIWKDPDASTRPETISIQLYRNGVAVDGQVATFAKDAPVLTHTFDNLDQYDANGKSYVYTVKEVDVDADGNLVVGGKDTGYDCTISGDTDDSSNFAYTVTNTINGGSTSVIVTKHWVDVNATEASRPDVTITLTGSDGKDYTCQFTGANDTETYTFTNLPLYLNGKRITYTAKETGLDGTAYTGQQEGLTFYNYLTETNDFSLNGSKSWVDKDAAHPASVDIVLQSDKAMGGTFVDVAGKTVTATEAGGWTFSFTDLPRYAYIENSNGTIVGIREIQYRVTDSVPNYTTTGGTAADGYVLTNTFQQEYLDIPVTKAWIDGNNTDGNRPVEVAIALFRNGVKFKEATIAAADDWKYIFEDLPKYSDNQKTEYEYKVYEMDGGNQVENDGTAGDYTVTYAGDNQRDITNKLTDITTGRTSAKVTKTWIAPWVDLPESITFKLYKTTGTTLDVNTAEFVQDVVLTKPAAESLEWTATVSDLPTRNAQGYHYTYFFEEQAVSGFELTDTNPAKTQFTNRIQQVSDVKVSVEKLWDGAIANSIPDSVFIQLCRDGASLGDIYNVELKPDADGKWTYTFENLDRYDLTTGKYYSYTVQEGYFTDNEGVKTWNPVAESETITFNKDTGDYTFQVSYNTTGYETNEVQATITNTYDSCKLYQYRVDRVYNYYSDGDLVPGASSMVTGDVTDGTKDQIITVTDEEADAFKKTDGKEEFTYVSGDPAVDDGTGKLVPTVTLTKVGEVYVITLLYEFRYNTPSPEYHKVTVNYYDEDGNKIAESFVSDRIREGRSWDFRDKERDTITVDGVTYVLDHADGDPITGTNIRRDQVVDLYYVAQESNVDIPDEDPPQGGEPDDPGVPDEPDVEIPDPVVPEGNLPQTGTTADQLSVSAGGLLSISAILAATGLVVVELSRRKEQEEN